MIDSTAHQAAGKHQGILPWHSQEMYQVAVWHYLCTAQALDQNPLSVFSSTLLVSGSHASQKWHQTTAGHSLFLPLEHSTC